jgi:hypothetical protein
VDPKQTVDHMRRQSMRVIAQAEDNGWKWQATIKPEPNVLYDNGPYRVDMEVERNGEKITVWWEEGRLLEAPLYSFAGVPTKLRNVSAMLWQMTQKPDPKATQRRMKKAVRVLDGAGASRLVEMIRDLPFDPEELDDRQLLRACYGKKLMWENSISGLVEQDVVQIGINFNAKVYHVTHSISGRRSINFHGQYGFRAVGVDALLRVG